MPHHRRSPRLQGYDYAQTGAYYVTVCVENRACLLGEIADGEMRLFATGTIVAKRWDNLPARFSMITLDAFVIMPNHVHGILVISGDEGAASSATTLGQVMRAFKSLSAIECNRALGREGQRFWQRGFYDHVVRDDADLNRLREYIQNNPAHWAEDEEYSQ